jgi:hypothetical protein
MNDEKPKSIWKKSWKGRSAVFVWCALFGIAIVLAVFIAALGKTNTSAGQTLVGTAVIAILLVLGVLFFIYAMIPFLRWLLWKHWRRTLFGLACFITLIALFYAEEDWRGKHDWEKFKRQWEAKGEQFDYASVIPPTVPDDQNFAMAPIWMELIEADSGTNSAAKLYGKKLMELERAGLTNSLPMKVYDWDNSDQQPALGSWEKGTLTDLRPWQTYYRTLAATTNLFPVPPQPRSPAADVLLALSKYDSAIEELRLASRLPYSRFPLDYDTEPPAAILLPHLATLKRCSQVLQLRAIAELQNAQTDKALDDIILMLYLANSIRTDPFLISHLVRIAIVNVTLQPIYEGLAEHKWSDAQLAELEQELGKLDLLSGYGVAVRGEMVLCQLRNIEYLRRLPEQFPNLVGEGDSETRRMAQICRLIPSGWFYQNELRCARLTLRFYLPIVDPNRRIVSPPAVRKADTAAEADFKYRNPYNILERMLLPAVGNASKKFAWDQESVDLARVACALERYRLAHGDYPESLDKLAPQFISRLPHDIIGGQPLHYHRTPDGQFVLYSVGWNEKDDGGTVVFYKGSPRADINKGDWVWRYPEK